MISDMLIFLVVQANNRGKAVVREGEASSLSRTTSDRTSRALYGRTTIGRPWKMECSSSPPRSLCPDDIH